MFISGRGWSARVRTVVEMRDLREIEIRGFGINWSCDRGSLTGIRACRLTVNISLCILVCGRAYVSRFLS